MSEYLRRNIVVKGRRTSISLESAIWSALEEICERESMTFNQIITLINDNLDKDTGRTSAARIFIVNYFRTMANNPELLKSGLLKLTGRNIKRLVNGPIASK